MASFFIKSFDHAGDGATFQEGWNRAPSVLHVVLRRQVISAGEMHFTYGRRASSFRFYVVGAGYRLRPICSAISEFRRANNKM